MARAKIYHFTELEQQSAVVAKAFAHPARVRIMAALKEQGLVPYSTLTRIVPLAGGTLNQHLEMLSRAGLIATVELADGRAGYGLQKEAQLAAYEMMVELLAA